MTVMSHGDRRPCFEALESRLLLDGNIWVGIADGELRVTGDAADNNVVLTGLDGGGYRVTGIHHAGGMTTINGATFVEFDNVPLLRILVDLGGGDDVMNVGSTDQLDTTVNHFVDISLGSGTNTLNIGRYEHYGSLGFAGQVTINGGLVVDNRTFGSGNVLITGAHMGSLDADLGYGDGEKSVVIADLWHGMAYHPPSDIHDVRTFLTGPLTISNPAGQLDALISDTTATLVNITTADGDDDIDLIGVDFNETTISTYDGRDHIEFGESEYRGNEIFGLTVDTGWHDDTVIMSDTVVALHTDIDMGHGGARWGQTLHIAAFGDCDVSSLTVRGRAVTVAFNDFSGINETLINGDLDIQTHSGDVTDRVDMQNVRVTGSTSVELRGGDDWVSVRESHLYDEAIFDLRQGNDTFLMGQLYERISAGENTRVGGSLIVDTGDGSDQVAITKAEVDGLLFVQLGASAGRGQRVRIATVGGTVHAAALGIAGDGRTNVFIGNTIEAHPSVEVDGILSISTGMDRSRDVVVVQNALIGGTAGISTGAGNDVVVLQRTVFEGLTTAHLGDGVDVLSIWDCHFATLTEFHTGEMRDVLWILDSTFDSVAIFNGGGARDFINRSLRSRNTFALTDQPIVEDFEREF